MNQDIQFKSWLESKELAPRTVKEYLRYLNRARFDRDLSQQNVNDFLSQNNNSVARAFVKNFKAFLLRNNPDKPLFPVEIDRIKAIELPVITGRHSRKVPRILTVEEVNMIADSTNNDRDEIMIRLTFFAGLRRSELINVKYSDFNFKKWARDATQPGELHIPHAKEDKSRTVLIPSNLMEYIAKWINYNYKYGRINLERPLFVKGTQWWNILRKASRKALNRSVKPHLLRHSIATFLIEAGWDISEVGKFLGHKDLQSTQIYLHISQKKIKEKYSDTFKALSPKGSQESQQESHSAPQSSHTSTEYSSP